MKVFKIGTRRSPMARVQCALVIEALQKKFPQNLYEEVIVLSSGDKKQGTEAARCGDKKDWIDGFEDLLLTGEIDIAVHSAKDVPVDLLDGLEVSSVLERKHFADAFIGKKINFETNERYKFKDLPSDSSVGMASLRRKAELKIYRPDLNFVEVRGNVHSRIAMLDDSADIQGLIVSEAGLHRLGVNLNEFESLDMYDFLPAVNQGTLLAEFASKNLEAAKLISALTIDTVEVCTRAERRVIEILKADCKSAVGVYARYISDVEIKITAQVFDQNSPLKLASEEKGLAKDYLMLAEKVATQLIEAGAERLLHF